MSARAFIQQIGKSTERHEVTLRLVEIDPDCAVVEVTTNAAEGSLRQGSSQQLVLPHGRGRTIVIEEVRPA